MITCDTAGCSRTAVWKTNDGFRFCDECKRDIVQYEKEVGKNLRTIFIRETR